MKPTKQLAVAASAADRNQVIRLLKETTALATDWQPIMDACFMGHTEIVALLLKHGADPNVLSASLLDPACWSGNLEMVRLLLDHGAALENGDTLNHAACDGNFEILDLLLARGVDINDRRGTEHHGGYTPFGCAVTLSSERGKPRSLWPKRRKTKRPCNICRN